MNEAGLEAAAADAVPAGVGMVERVRQALYDALEHHLCDADGLSLQGGRFFISGADCHVDGNALAYAAIKGMHAATDEMVEAGREVVFKDRMGPRREAKAAVAVDVYRAFLDAALSEEPSQ